MERKKVLSVRTGSFVRNLHTEASDIDTKLFVAPTLDDLIDGYVHKTFVVGDEEDVETHDVRRLRKLFFQSNITYLEVMFSKEYIIYDPSMQKILNMREDICRMNIHNLFDSSMGVFNRNVTELEKITSDKVATMIETFGYNTKKAMMAIHFLRTIQKYHANGFNNFASCIWYEGKEREEMIGYKNGSLNLAEMRQLLNHELRTTEAIRADFVYQVVNDSTNRLLNSYIREIVRRNMD